MGGGHPSLKILTSFCLTMCLLSIYRPTIDLPNTNIKLSIFVTCIGQEVSDILVTVPSNDQPINLRESKAGWQSFNYS